jgi:hypothetical protein
MDEQTVDDMDGQSVDEPSEGPSYRVPPPTPRIKPHQHPVDINSMVKAERKMQEEAARAARTEAKGKGKAPVNVMEEQSVGEGPSYRVAHPPPTLRKVESCDDLFDIFSKEQEAARAAKTTAKGKGKAPVNLMDDQSVDEGPSYRVPPPAPRIGTREDPSDDIFSMEPAEVEAERELQEEAARAARTAAKGKGKAPVNIMDEQSDIDLNALGIYSIEPAEVDNPFRDSWEYVEDSFDNFSMDSADRVKEQPREPKFSSSGGYRGRKVSSGEGRALCDDVGCASGPSEIPPSTSGGSARSPTQPWSNF